MPEIIFKSDEGVAWEKTVYKNGRCKVELRSTDDEHGLRSMTYRFKNVPIFHSPYLSWENLMYVASRFEDPYLHTAVQQGKKLYADISFAAYDEDFVKSVPQHNLTTQKDVDAAMEKIKSELPPDCFFGIHPYGPERYGVKLRNAFVCKKGAITDFIDFEQVLHAYDQLGIVIVDVLAKRIRALCQTPLIRFSEENAPFDIFNTRGGEELIVTGLLLGYPIESTAWLLERDGYFPTKK